MPKPPTNRSWSPSLSTSAHRGSDARVPSGVEPRAGRHVLEPPPAPVQEEAARFVEPGDVHVGSAVGVGVTDRDPAREPLVLAEAAVLRLQVLERRRDLGEAVRQRARIDDAVRARADRRRGQVETGGAGHVDEPRPAAVAFASAGSANGSAARCAASQARGSGVHDEVGRRRAARSSWRPLDRRRRSRTPRTRSGPPRRPAPMSGPRRDVRREISSISSPRCAESRPG